MHCALLTFLAVAEERFLESNASLKKCSCLSLQIMSGLFDSGSSFKCIFLQKGKEVKKERILFAY